MYAAFPDASSPVADLAGEQIQKPEPSRTIGLVWRNTSPREHEFRLLADLLVPCGMIPLQFGQQADTKAAGTDDPHKNADTIKALCYDMDGDMGGICEAVDYLNGNTFAKEAPMTALSYTVASVPVREELSAAHMRAWQRLAKPGYWWTGAERVAIASEVRNAWQCPLCKERKAALSPYTISGDHDRVSTLPEAALDVIHRVTTDSGRLTKAWYDKILASGQISDRQYVEIIDVLVGIVSIDSFCHGIGVPVHSLPEPEPGSPSGYRPTAAQLENAWVPTIPSGQATGAEADLYGESGQAANVIRALSLIPDAVRQLLDLSAAHYLPVEQMRDFTRGRTLSRAQMELLAGRVSALRECFY